MIPKLQKARLQVTMKDPFIGTLLLHADLREDAHVTDTMATDGQAIYYNPEFVEATPPPHLQGLLAHEVLHCALDHHARHGNRDPQRWNYATDYAINPLLFEGGYALPEGALYNPEYCNLSAEEIYARLPQPDDPSSPFSLKALVGAVFAPQDQTETNENGGNVPKMPDWKSIMAKAAQVAKAAGNLPGHYEELVEKLIHPTVDWRSALRTYLKDKVRSDYSWSRPNRRHIAQGLYLPSLYSDGMESLAVAIDTSGSVDKDKLTAFCSELDAIRQDLSIPITHYTQFDTKLYQTQELGMHDPTPTEAQGRGGTDATCAVEWANNLPTQPNLLIIFTDGYLQQPNAAPHSNVLWVTTNAVEDFMEAKIKIKLEAA